MPEIASGHPSLQDGLERQRAGDLNGAETVYLAILEKQPEHAMARVLLGLTWCASNRAGLGIELIREVAGNTNSAFAHFSLGQALAGHNQPAEAVLSFRRSIGLHPGVLAAHTGLGHALSCLGDYAAAATAFQTALTIDPADPEPHLCMGVLLHRTGRPRDAIAPLRNATDLAPLWPNAWAALGGALLTLGETVAATAAFRHEVALDPDSALAHLHLGDSHQARRDYSVANDCYQHAIKLCPMLPDAHCHLSNALYNLGLFEAAAEAAMAAIALQNSYADAHSNRGNALLALSRYDEAEEAYRTAIRLQPSSAVYHSNLGSVLTAQRRVSEALQAQRQALTIDPDFTDARYNHAISLLLDGQFEEGWQYYEARWQLPGNLPRCLPRPAWTGEELAGRLILLHAEQGLGDMLQMARYVPLVAEQGGRVILEVHAPLVRLLRHLPGVQQVFALGSELPAFDLHCPMFSLPMIFKTRLDTIPADPYLATEPTRAPANALRSLDELSVGLVWAGTSQIGPHVNQQRSITPVQLAPLAEIPGVRLHSLQKDPDPNAIATMAALGIVDLMTDVEDFADTATVIAGLDLIISVDTSTAHLAAGMGKPVWLLSRFSGCWRWLIGCTDSPWYPTMRIYRQSKDHSWTPIIDQVSRDLRLALTEKQRSA